MTQRFQVQEGKIIFSSVSNLGGPAPAVDMTVEGQILVGNDNLSDGIIQSSSGQDLILEATAGGNIRLQSNSGNVVINNSVWPQQQPAPGMFLGAVSLNTLEFQPFFLSPDAPSDSYTEAQLNVDYPSAQVGQFVRAPTVVYQCVGVGEWRTLGGGGGGGPSCLPCPPNDIGIVYASPSADYQLLTGQGWPAIVGVVSSGSPQLIQADAEDGWVLTSNGPGNDPSFRPSSSLADPEVYVFNLSPASTGNFSGALYSSWFAQRTDNNPYNNVQWDAGNNQFQVTNNGLYEMFVESTVKSPISALPEGITMYGFQLFTTNSDSFVYSSTTQKTLRYIPEFGNIDLFNSPISGSADEQTVTGSWVFSAWNTPVNVGLVQFAYKYNASDEYQSTATVTIKRIGQPFPPV